MSWNPDVKAHRWLATSQVLQTSSWMDSDAARLAGGNLRAGGDACHLLQYLSLETFGIKLGVLSWITFRDLARATFRLATGHWDGPLFAPESLDKLREEWFDMLPDPLRARELIPHQPFYLRAIAQTLRILEDPDYHVIEEGKFCFVNGVDVGHTAPLGPVPQVLQATTEGPKIRRFSLGAHHVKLSRWTRCRASSP